MTRARTSIVRLLAPFAAASAALTIGSASVLAQSALPTQWVGTWGASPSDPLPGAVSATAAYDSQTLREIAHLSIGGSSVRIRLSNALGTTALSVGAVHVARSAGNDAVAPRSDRTVTFSGQASITIPVGAQAISDPVDLAVAAQSDLAVSIYLPQQTGPLTQHSLAQQTSYVASGDETGAVRLTSPATIQVRPLLSVVEVAAAAQAVAVVTFGDSITDGYHSTVDLDRRWPDDFSRRLQARYGNKVGVINEGISGNRVLNEIAGPNAQERLDRDALSQAGVKYVTLLEGINDIGFSQVTGFTSQAVSADDIIAGYRQIIARVHDKGIKIYGGTLTPFVGAGYASPEGEAKREAVNAFVRDSGEFDGVLDFDAALRDPANPTMMLPAYDSGDHLHPNDDGYEVMAYSIDLSLFKPGAN